METLSAGDAPEDAALPPQVAPVSFKKPARRGNVRKRERAEDDEPDAADRGGGEQSGSGPRWAGAWQPTSCSRLRITPAVPFCARPSPPPPPGPLVVRSMSLEMVRELQRQRQRAKGVTLEVKGMADAVDEALAAGGAEATEHGLESTFTSQTDSGEVDPNMLKYIEEQMHGGGGDGGGAAAGASVPTLDPEEAELYVVPAHLRGFNPKPEHNAVEDSANRWLAGIAEVPLGTDAKMAVIEETEKAKRAMMAKREGGARHRAPEPPQEGHQLTIPANFNSNFHQHRREHAIARKALSTSDRGHGGGGAGGGARGTRDLASDGSAYGKFKAHVRNSHR